MNGEGILRVRDIRSRVDVDSDGLVQGRVGAEEGLGVFEDESVCAGRAVFFAGDVVDRQGPAHVHAVRVVVLAASSGAVAEEIRALRGAERVD